MKERCQCGKPEGLMMPLLGSRDPNMTMPCKIDPVFPLHFKAADRYCERCGAGLCEECSYFGSMTDYLCDTNYLCHTCAELQEEQ